MNSFYCGIVVGDLGIVNAAVYFIYSTGVGHFNALIFALILFAFIAVTAAAFADEEEGNKA